MVDPLDALASGGASILGRPLRASELESFGKYLKLLQKWQRTQRLVGSADAGWIVEHLFLDSLLFLRVLPPDVASIADVGSGAGLPGIPIKIVSPGLRLALIESRGKRTSFLSAVVRELDLRGTEVVTARAEEYARDRGQAFGAVVMRCAGDFGDLARTAQSLVTQGGLIVAAGPPSPRALDLGEWVEVRGVKPGSTRRFAVHRMG